MPGIAGIISRRWSENHAASLQRMLEACSAEPFDVKGSAIFEAVAAGAAWVCHEGAFAARMPVWNATHDVALVLTGETFADHGQSNLVSRAGTNPAQQLLEQYERSGLAFLENLNGWFSGLLVDLKTNKAVLFNDRYGLKRICFHQDGDTFYFASEAKSLLAVLPRLRALDPQGLAEFWSCGCVMQNRTFFPGVALLPGGSCWTFLPDGSCRQETYFAAPTWEQQPSLSAREYSERLRETMQRVLPAYLNGSQPVGISMTGGIDSRIILAWAKPEGRPLPCYTFGGPFRDCADVRLARQLSSACGLAHQIIPVGDEFLSEFPKLAAETVSISDGTMDVSGAVELYVNRRARRIAPVRLTGNYGSEILRSYVAFRPRTLDRSMFSGEFLPQLDRSTATYAAENKTSRLSFIAFKQVPWHHYARSSIEQSQVTVRSPYLDNALVKLAFQAPPELAGSAGHLLQLIADGNPTLGRIGTDRSLRQNSIPLFSRMSRAYQEFTAKAEYAYDYGMPNWLAKIDRVLAPAHFERLFLGRHKFYHFRLWYRDALAGHVKSVLLDDRALARPYLNRSRVQAIVQAHTSGTENHTLEIHKLLTLELLQRQLIEGN